PPVERAEARPGAGADRGPDVGKLPAAGGRGGQDGHAGLAAALVAGPVPPPGTRHLVKLGTEASPAAGTRDPRDAGVIQLRESPVITVAFRGPLRLLPPGRAP